MTEKQERFCEHYAQVGNAAEAARRAGYSVKSARSIGNELLTKHDIWEKIARMTDGKRKDRIADAAEIQAFWTSVMRDQNEKTADRLTASVSLAKCAGMFTIKAIELQQEEKPDVVIYLPALEQDNDEEDE